MKNYFIALILLDSDDGYEWAVMFNCTGIEKYSCDAIIPMIYHQSGGLVGRRMYLGQRIERL